MAYHGSIPNRKIIFTNLAKSGVEDGMWPLSFPGHGASRFGAQNWCKSSVVQSRRLPQRVPQHWIAQLNLRSVVQQKRIGALVENPPPKKKHNNNRGSFSDICIYLYVYIILMSCQIHTFRFGGSCGWIISPTSCCVASMAIVNCCSCMDGSPGLHLEGVRVDVS